jgi:hypothetical protein
MSIYDVAAIVLAVVGIIVVYIVLSKRASTNSKLTDELLNANKRIDSLSLEVTQLKGSVNLPQTTEESYQDNDNVTLLVGIGTEPNLQIDLPKLRGMKTRKGPVSLMRLLPVTSTSLAKVLQSARGSGSAIRWVHLATKATAKGVELADGTFTGEWLSGELSGVEALLLNGCDTFEIGDMLPGIPLVATTLERISHEDAQVLAGVFWQAVADGLTPSEVKRRCQQRLPTNLMEMVYIR